MPLPETPIDVSIESVRRLGHMANVELATTIAIHGERSYQYSYWTGYLRAIQHVLEMENE